MSFIKSTFIVILSLLILTHCKDSGTDGGEGDKEPSLRNTVSYPFGAATQTARLSSGAYVGLLRDEFSSVTAEYQMKMSPMYNNPNTINFSDSDAFVDFAESTEGRVHGHALIWHAATPSWIENYSGTDAQFEALIEDYVKTVVGRYEGRIASWDVVNEAISDESGNPLRNSVFLQRMGEDYIAKVFRWAREADPDVLLFYNDYNMAINGSKFNAMLELVDGLIEDGVPIDGVGFQMHISYNGPSRSQIQAATGQIVLRDLMLHYSELDIRVNPSGTETELTKELVDRFTDKMVEVVEIYNQVPEELQFGITMWGVQDDDTWLRSFWNNQYEWPLLFDDNFDPKPAYDEVLDLF